MTVRELRQLLKGLPNDMNVVMEGEGDYFITVCKEQSDIETIIAKHEEYGNVEEAILVLRPCTCSQEVKANPQTDINLN